MSKMPIEELEKLREEYGMNKEEITEPLDISLETYSKWLTRPDDSQLKKIRKIILDNQKPIEHLERLRKEYGTSKEKLAEALKISPIVYMAWIHNNYAPSAEEIKRAKFYIDAGEAKL